MWSKGCSYSLGQHAQGETYLRDDRSGKSEAARWSYSPERRARKKRLSPFIHASGEESEVLCPTTQVSASLDASNPTRQRGTKMRIVSPYFDHANGKESDPATQVSASIDAPNPCRRRRGTKKRVVVVSPYFDHANGKDNEVSCPETQVSASIVAPNTSGQRRGTKKRVVVVSPYFDHANGKEIDPATQVSASIDAPNPCRRRRGMKKRVVVVSPYLDHANGKDNEVLCPETQVSASIVAPNTSRQRRGAKKRVVVVSPYFNHANGKESEGLGPATQVSASTDAPTSSRRRSRKKQPMVLSPFFDHANGEEKGEVLCRTVNVSSHFQTGGSCRVRWDKKDDAYRRKSAEDNWEPPRSKYSLLQEDHFSDPWRVLVICMLLNRTTGLQAGKVLSNLFSLCPDAKAAIEVEVGEIEKVIRTLGLQKKRAAMIQRFSGEYLEDGWTHVTQLHGVGKYAADAHAMFCTGNWLNVRPQDHMLEKYWKLLISGKMF